MLSRLCAAAAVLFLAAGSVGCSRPSAKDCEEMLTKWFTMIYWEKAEAEIAAAPAEQREALRQTRTVEHDRQLKGGMELGVMQCRGARDHDFVKCMKDASNATQARKCRPPKD